jgi:hypothetical protein
MVWSACLFLPSYKVWAKICFIPAALMWWWLTYTEAATPHDLTIRVDLVFTLRAAVSLGILALIAIVAGRKRTA